MMPNEAGPPARRGLPRRPLRRAPRLLHADPDDQPGRWPREIRELSLA